MNPLMEKILIEGVITYKKEKRPDWPGNHPENAK